MAACKFKPNISNKKWTKHFVKGLSTLNLELFKD